MSKKPTKSTRPQRGVGAEAPAAVAVVSTTGLTKSYGEAVALAPIDIEVSAGQRITLIGHNGSGKTTLIRMLAGMLEPSGGAAAVGRHHLGSVEARAALSYLADEPVFYDDLSVWEHLEFIARLHGTEDWEQHAVDLLDAVGIVDRADDLPMTFSRGLKQKAAIAMAFVRPFDVMVVDEPFVGLDRTGRAALLDLFRSAHADGAALVVATHELSSVADSERVIALSGGVVTFDGPAAKADVVALTEGLPPIPD
jgi:ABC-type multidrug transport system ATPase subunit